MDEEREENNFIVFAFCLCFMMTMGVDELQVEVITAVADCTQMAKPGDSVELHYSVRLTVDDWDRQVLFVTWELHGFNRDNWLTGVNSIRRTSVTSHFK